MDGRCFVEILTDLGMLVFNTYKVKHGWGTKVFVYSDCDEVYVCDAVERKLTAILQFPDPVIDLVEKHNSQLIFVACQSGVYCINFLFLPPRSQGSTSSCPTLKITSDFLAISRDGVSALLFVDSVLLTLSQKNTSWVLSLYKTLQISSEAKGYEELVSFSLPLVVTQSKTEITKPPVLVCVHSGDSTQSPANTTSAHDCFQLEPVLFKLLFGVEAAFAKSPVILCGLPDGRLCFFPFYVPAAQFKVFYSLEQQVMFIGASGTGQNDSGPAQCLVAIGEQGRAVLIRTEKGDPENAGIIAGFTEGCLWGPVKCVCVDRNSVYYSTGSDLYQIVLKLSEESTKEEDQQSSKTMVAPFQSPISLNVCRVIAMARPTYNAAGEIQLISLSVTGKLQVITLPARKQEEESLKILSSQHGCNIKDLLSTIGDVCERASVLEATNKSKHQQLTKINQVVNISLMLTASPQTNQIQCHGTVMWSRLIQDDSFNLICVLDNSSPYVLEQGWTLCVTVSPLSCSSTAQEETSSTNFSFPFCNLHPKETLQVTVPVASAGEITFPLTVSCSLMFSLSALLGKEELSTFPDQQKNCFSLPLNTLTVDWLHALRIISPTSAHKMITPLSSNFMAHGAEAFLRSNNLNFSRGTERGDSNSRHENYFLNILVSSQLLRDALKFRNPKESELVHHNLCLNLIGWLLWGSAGGVKTEQDEIELSSPVVLAHCPNKATVKLTAKEVNVGDESATGEIFLKCVDIDIESRSSAAVCGLHHALLSRIQILLHSAPEKASYTREGQDLGLKLALQRARMHHSEISRGLSVSISLDQRSRLLRGIYQTLRQKPIIII